MSHGLDKLNPYWRGLQDANLKPCVNAVDRMLGAKSMLHEEPALSGRAFARLEAEGCLSKLSRYEAAIERGLYRALHELQRLQATRAGQLVPPPA